ncbi:hypothetical protein HZS_2832 [Henneguya salminicola]|nr:hypothetical protein HZS_2832 [Henneguya salminicola]
MIIFKRIYSHFLVLHIPKHINLIHNRIGTTVLSLDGIKGLSYTKNTHLLLPSKEVVPKFWIEAVEISVLI